MTVRHFRHRQWGANPHKSGQTEEHAMLIQLLTQSILLEGSGWILDGRDAHQLYGYSSHCLTFGA